jgi:hypothetical protein
MVNPAAAAVVVAMKRRRVMPSCASMWISVGAGGLS